MKVGSIAGPLCETVLATLVYLIKCSKNTQKLVFFLRI